MIVHNDFEAAFAASHEALASMAEANPRPSLELWSRRDDAVLANPLGPPKGKHRKRDDARRGNVRRRGWRHRV